MEAAGILGWPPDALYAASLPELLLALSANLKSRGLLTPADAPGMSRAELTDLMERYAL